MIKHCYMNTGSGREAQTLAILAKFENKLRTVQRLEDSYKDEDDEVEASKDKKKEEEEEEETDEGW